MLQIDSQRKEHMDQERDEGGELRAAGACQRGRGRTGKPRARARIAVGAAIGWGALAASSLVIGALIGLVRPWPRKLVGLVLGFGAGALISAVSFELFGEGVKLAGAVPVAIGLGVGAMTYFVAAGRVATMGGGGALALGAFLDGIPEQMVLGIGLAGGEPVSAGLLAAIFVSNLPEAIGGATDMHKEMHSA